MLGNLKNFRKIFDEIKKVIDLCKKTKLIDISFLINNKYYFCRL